MTFARRCRSSRLRPRGRRGGRSRRSRFAVLGAAVGLGAFVLSRLRGRNGSTAAPAASSGGRTERFGDTVPEADWLDQHRDVVAAPGPDRPSADPEVPVVDALDQASPVGPGEIVDVPSRDPEAPDADALEQAISLPPDDDGER